MAKNTTPAINQLANKMVSNMRIKLNSIDNQEKKLLTSCVITPKRIATTRIAIKTVTIIRATYFMNPVIEGLVISLRDLPYHGIHNNSIDINVSCDIKKERLFRLHSFGWHSESM